ncbi:histidine kinase dimerization/phosphoacceptor domain -containing protein [Desulfococcaceae bacterium HSG7]|nr:histidine kinase dimerization/phosphoacceptor domain -containing protein [Desulfococcaceae bacterium HSG7]
MAETKPSYEVLAARLTKAESYLQAIRSGKVDMIVGADAALSVQLAETQQALEKRTEELAKTNVTLQNEVAEHKQAQEELAKYRDHLEVLVLERTAELSRTVEEVERQRWAIMNVLQDLSRSNKKLANEKSLSEEYINSLPGLFYVFDEERFVRWNKQWEIVSGYSSDELAEMYSTDFFQGSDKIHIAEKMKEVFTKGVSGAEAELVTKQGRRIFYYFSGSRIEINGKPHLIGLGINIAERKRAEEQVQASLREKEVLLKEIHHRVKNNMQVISSLLNLQANQIEDEHIHGLFKESQNRIRSMAFIHEKLYENSDLAQIEFEDYLYTLASNIFRSYLKTGIQFIIEAEDIFLDIKIAIPCGLLINELISNALKYAFPEGRTGNIYITMCPTDDNDLVITVRDDGIGFPEGIDFRDTDSFGLQLVNMMTEQLSGTIELNSKEGTTFIITFPVKGEDHE